MKHNLDEWFHYVTLFNFAFFQQTEIILQIINERKTKQKKISLSTHHFHKTQIYRGFAMQLILLKTFNMKQKK
jgi:hypothetical protein